MERTEMRVLAGYGEYSWSSIGASPYACARMFEKIFEDIIIGKKLLKEKNEVVDAVLSKINEMK